MRCPFSLKFECFWAALPPNSSCSTYVYNNSQSIWGGRGTDAPLQSEALLQVMTFYYAAWSLALLGSETYTHFTRKLSCKKQGVTTEGVATLGGFDDDRKKMREVKEEVKLGSVVVLLQGP